MEKTPSPSTKPEATMRCRLRCDAGRRRRQHSSSSAPATRGSVHSGGRYMPMPKAMPDGSQLRRARGPKVSSSGSSTPAAPKAAEK
eukprot:scaffold40637_cov66-Phaeocystis_antarctica.AAC.2